MGKNLKRLRRFKTQTLENILPKNIRIDWPTLKLDFGFCFLPDIFCVFISFVHDLSHCPKKQL